MIFFLLALLAAEPVPTDAGVTIVPRTTAGTFSRVPLGYQVVFEVHAGWNGVGVPENVVVNIDVPGTIEAVATPADGKIVCSSERPIRCTMAAQEIRYSERIIITTTQAQPGDFSARASITTTSLDDFQANNFAAAPLQVVDRPALAVRGSEPLGRFEPGQPGRASVYVVNEGVGVDNLTLTFTAPNGGTFTAFRIFRGEAMCAVDPDKVVCTSPRAEYQVPLIVEVSFLAPERLDGGEVIVHAEATHPGADLDPSDNALDFRGLLVAHLLVTNIADEGPGSLRQALLDAREQCASSPCTIEFRMPEAPGQERFTIRPAAPLPEVWGRVKIDGGGTIEIDGSSLREGNGLVLRTGCDVSVLGLAITGFPRHAIEIQDETRTYVCPGGVYYPIIAGNQLSANERGVVQSAGVRVDIINNRITGNRRAGIFLGNGFYASITGNTITGNGASGIFLNLGDSGRSTTAGAHVEHNVIANNGEWGICRTANGEIAIRDNAIYGNVSAGVDIGLDNDTPNRDDDWRSFPNKPELFSALYDPAAGTTTIRGRLESGGAVATGYFLIDVYASSSLSLWGYAQGEERVGGITLMLGHAGFEVVVPGDLRGKFITATNTRVHTVGFAKPPLEQSHEASVPSETSEFSNPVEGR